MKDKYLEMKAMANKIEELRQELLSTIDAQGGIMGYLMTATLLGSFKWMQDAPASWVQRARDDFYAKVRRTDVGSKYAMQ